MVVLKTRRELALMRDACRISAEALQIAGEAVKPGVTTAEIDRIAYSYIVKQGATPNFLHIHKRRSDSWHSEQRARHP